MEDAGIWLRVSTGGQDEANQEPDLLRYCESHGYRIAKTYTVHGKSAFHGRQQKDLDQALSDMRDGLIKVLVIWHSDRLERREGKALLDVLAEFAKAGGRVESVQEPTLGQLDFSGQVTTFLTGLMNHEKSKHISEQITLAHARIDEARAFRGRIPFGYRTTGPKYAKILVPTDEGREVIPVAYQMIAEGKSLSEVGLYLKEKTGREWWANIVAEMIRRPVYRGHHANSKGVTVHRCEALVDAALWKRANDSLAARPKRGKVYAANRAMLAGVLSCSKCGGPMSRMTDGRGSQFYRCTGRGPNRKGCGKGHMVAVPRVDAAVNKIIAETFNTHVMIRTLVPGTDHSAELAELAYELQQLPLQGLSWDDEDSRRAELRAEYERIKALPVVPDEWVEVPNGHTYSGVWEGLETPERGAWLKAKGFIVTASNAAVTVSRGATSITVSLSG